MTWSRWQIHAVILDVIDPYIGRPFIGLIWMYMDMIEKCTSKMLVERDLLFNTAAVLIVLLLLALALFTPPSILTLCSKLLELASRTQVPAGMTWLNNPQIHHAFQVLLDCLAELHQLVNSGAITKGKQVSTRIRIFHTWLLVLIYIPAASSVLAAYDVWSAYTGYSDEVLQKIPEVWSGAPKLSHKLLVYYIQRTVCYCFVAGIWITLVFSAVLILNVIWVVLLRELTFRLWEYVLILRRSQRCGAAIQWLRNTRIAHLCEQLNARMLTLCIELEDGVDTDGYPLSKTGRLRRSWTLYVIMVLLCAPFVGPIFSCMFYMLLPQSYYDVHMSHMPNFLLRPLVDNVKFMISLTLISEILVCLTFSTIFGWNWFSDIILKTSRSFRQKLASSLHSECTHVSTDSQQCQPECETLRQKAAERTCKMCYTADLDSIVLSCGHIDLCGGCVEKMLRREPATLGECPEYETRCHLYGTVHTHCLICRSGGERRRVFFA